MPALNLAGPSYPLRAGIASVQRTVNYMPVQVESGQEKARAYLKQIPGLVAKGSSIGAGVRGLYETAGRLFAVAGSALYEVSSAWVFTSLGTLGSASGRVGMVANNTQLAVVDGVLLYVYDLGTGVFSTQSAPLGGSPRADMLDGYGIFFDAGTTQFYISDNQDFTVIDPLNYASAEGATGDIQGFIVKHRELLILKTHTGEVWYDAGNADFAFARQEGANIEVGLAAPWTLQKIAGTAYWLGQDEKGSRIVFGMGAYTPQRISSHALEEALSAIADVSDAYAFTYHQEGLTFYALQVPGLETTWVYEAAAGIWHERAELVNGELAPWRATAHAFAFGKHLVGDDEGQLYEMDVAANDNAGDALCRDRITPHYALPTLVRQRVGSLQIECDVGDGLPSGFAAKMLLRYSDDGGRTWGNWRELGLGNVGQYRARARATMLGSARDRVWHIRVTDPVTCNLLSAIVNEV